MCIEMGNAGFPFHSWDTHENGKQIAQTNGNGANGSHGNGCAYY